MARITVLEKKFNDCSYFNGNGIKCEQIEMDEWEFAWGLKCTCLGCKMKYGKELGALMDQAQAKKNLFGLIGPIQLI